MLFYRDKLVRGKRSFGMNTEEIKEEIFQSHIVSVIYNEVQKLRNSTEEKKAVYRQRWIWELIQNAVDSRFKDRKVDIVVNYDSENNVVCFSHNGRGFSVRDLWGLVTQTSGKQNDTESVGQFGTGFITTTLLTPQIKINSFIEDTGRAFEIILDRSGITRDEIEVAVKDNLQVLNNLDMTARHDFPSGVWTTFTYQINKSKERELSNNAVQIGLDSLKKHIGFLLTFTSSINSLTINGTRYTICETKPVEDIESAKIVRIAGDGTESIHIFQKTFSEGSIAALVEVDSNNYFHFKPFEAETSRLSCKFPLMGTEDFPMPMVVDSPSFNVTLDRDDIQRTDTQNDSIIQQVLEQYNFLLEFYKKSSAARLFNICQFNHEQGDKFSQKLIKKIDKIIYEIPMIQTTSGDFFAINDEFGEKQVSIPFAKVKKNREIIWILFSKIDNLIIPVQEYSDGWGPVVNNNIGVTNIQQKMDTQKDLNGFQSWMGGDNIISWLNEYYEIVNDNVGNKQVTEIGKILFPAKNGVFTPLKDIYSSNNFSKDIIDLYLLIYPEEGEKFILDKVNIPPHLTKGMKITNELELATKIEDRINSLLTREKGKERRPETQEIFAKLLSFFAENVEESQRLFPSIYSNRGKLRPKGFEEELNNLGDIISDQNLSIGNLNKLLTSDDFLDVLNSEPELSAEIIEKLKHESIPDIQYAIKVQAMINRSIERVFCYLSENGRYEVPASLQEWLDSKMSNTVFRAKKDGGDVFIVIRPSDGDKIIFYHETETSTLSADHVELWTDNGTEVMRITLGDLLMKTNINVIPLKNLYSGDRNGE